jgi:ribosomal protein L33
MDYEYLQNVMGSPYIDEGRFDRLKAKGAQAMGAVGAMAGYQIQNPTETKLKSLWEGFMSSLKKVMRDWEGQVAPMFDEQIPLNGKQRRVKGSLDQLASLLKPIGLQIPNTRDPETYVKGSAYTQPTTPSKTPSKLTELIDESLWDFANRGMGLNKALGSNDPSTIMDKYKNYILSLFKKFMKDAIKMTKMTESQIYSILAKMQHSRPGLKVSGNMQKVVKQLQTLQNIGDLKGKGAASITAPPPVAAAAPPVPTTTTPTAMAPPTAPPTPTTPPAPVPPVAAIPPSPPTSPPTSSTASPAPPAAAPAPASPATTPPASSTASTAPPGGGVTILPQEYPYIILHAIRIINKAVEADVDRIGHFFDKDKSGTYIPLPTDFSGEPLTKESKLGWLLKEIVTPAKNKSKEEPENPTEFLYNFHSKFSKYPGQPFSIYVPLIGISDEVPELPGVKIKVIFNCTKSLNRIYVITDKNGKKSPPVMIMQFYDHHASSQAGATGGGSNQFSIEKLVRASNPTAESKLKNAPPKILSDINKESDKFMRSLMATIHRKSMEFKSKSTEIEEHPEFEKALNIMLKSGKEENTSIKLLHNAWKELIDQKEPEEITSDDLINMCTGAAEGVKMSADGVTPEALVDGIMALMKLGHEKTEATTIAKNAWMKIEQNKLKPANQITGSDITKMALSNKLDSEPEPEPEPDTSDGQLPPGPPTTPVSGAAGAPAPTTKPTAPVSSPGGTVSKPKTIKLPTIDPQNGENRSCFHRQPR